MHAKHKYMNERKNELTPTYKLQMRATNLLRAPPAESGRKSQRESGGSPKSQSEPRGRNSGEREGGADQTSVHDQSHVHYLCRFRCFSPPRVNAPLEVEL
eukprot:3399343-Pyramimonas_sp.AAC.1